MERLLCVYLLWLEAICFKQTFGHLRENFLPWGGISQKVSDAGNGNASVAANQTFLSIGRKEEEAKKEAFVFQHPSGWSKN